MMKKAFTGILAFLLLLTMLTGCGGQAANPSDDGPVSTEVPEDSAPVEPEDESQPPEDPDAPEEETPAGDMSIYPIDGAEDISMWTPFQSPLTGLVDGFEDWPVVQLLEERTGVHMEYVQVPQTAAREKYNLMINSGDYCDMGKGVGDMYSSGVNGGFDDGVFMDITEYVENNMPFYNAAIDNSPWGREYFEPRLRDEANSYLFVSNVPSNTYDMNGMAIRSDWLEDCGLDIPTTMEEVENVLAVFTETYDLDNALLVNNENYFTLFSESLNISSGLNGSGYYVVDGEIVNGFMEDGYREQLSRMKRWYDAGYFGSDFITRTGNPKDPSTLEMISNGNCGVFETSIPIWSNLSDAAADESFSLAAIPTITDPSDGKQHFYDLGRIVTVGVCFFEGCRDPELCAQWLDYMFTDEAAVALAYGIEGESYKFDGNGEPQWDMDFLNSKSLMLGYSSSTYAEMYYGIKGNFVCLALADALFDFYSDEQLEGIEAYNDQSDWGDYWSLSVTLNADENQIAAKYGTEVSTYVQESSMKFITGELDIADDAAWEQYIATIDSLNESEVRDVYRSAYKRTLD